jgi:hypothetical protein
MVANTNYGTDEAPDHQTPEPNEASTVANGHKSTNDEETPLLPQDDSLAPKKNALAGVGTIIAVLLLGSSTSIFPLVDEP